MTYANVVATLALVFAMSGGALAATHYLITSTKQISPKVLSALKGKTGPAGAVGGAGATGSQGSQGPKGESGPAGKDGNPGAPGPRGPEGKEGHQGVNGAPGEQGEPGPPGSDGKDGNEGSPWTVNGTLPSEKTEMGQWGLKGKVSIVEGELEEHLYAISFPIPLKEAPTPHYIAKEQSPPPGCKGSVQDPQAEPGNLCVFVESVELNVTGPKFVDAATVTPNTAGKAGALMLFGATEAGEQVVFGTWAVTAK